MNACKLCAQLHCWHKLIHDVAALHLESTHRMGAEECIHLMGHMRMTRRVTGTNSPTSKWVV